jgi:hypothetical protein
MPNSLTPQETAMGLEIKVIVNRAYNLLVDNQARRTVTTPIRISDIVGEETDMMPLSNDDKSKQRWDTS